MTTGVVVMAYGTPATPDDVEAYYTHIRGGRTPAPELVADLRRRYQAIGGMSPLLEITRAQAAGIQQALGDDFVVKLGMKHARPFIEDAVDALAETGVEQLIALVLAPHYSDLSVGQYLDRARVAARARGVEVAAVESWYGAPGYVALMAGALASTSAHVVFTAHSLPARILEHGDPYVDQLHDGAVAIAARAGIADDRWSTAWQSAARSPEPWLGPSVLEVLPDLAARGIRDVVVCPHGFTADHLEILYDIDIDARGVADRHGISLTRTSMPNADPRLCDTLAAVIRDHVAVFI